jgi:hypothetical protein
MFLLRGAEARQCGRGIHYAISPAWIDPVHLDGASTKELRAFIDFLDDRFPELEAGAWVLVTDKAWHLIHRCLGDGTLDGGWTPGHLCVLGPTDAYWIERDDGTVDWIVNLLDPDKVREAAEFVTAIDAAELWRRYDAIDPAECDYEPWEYDFESSLDCFLQLKEFFRRASGAGRWVVFVAGGPAGPAPSGNRPED